MPSGIARSPWLPVLAKQLGMKNGKLRGILNRNGYHAPYLDEPRAIRILHKEGHIKATATGVKKESHLSKRKGAHTAQLPRSAQSIEKQRSAWAMRLVPRLARILPEGDSEEGKKRVKKILRRGGYEGPRWDDEARAIAIFKAEGISVEGFEYLQGNAATEIVISDHPVQMTLIPKTSMPASAAGRGSRNDMAGVMDHRECLKMLGYISTLLSKYERDLFEQIRIGHISRLSAPLDIPLVALNEMRPKVKVG